MLWILIASTGSQEYLEETLKNLSWLPQESRLVISLHAFTGKTSFSRGEVIVRSKPLLQFDHYALLEKELPIADNDRVILLDDDDILLPGILKETGSFVGYQILADNENVGDFTEYLISHPATDIEIHQQRLVTDLSGTTTSGYHFKQYFMQRPNLWIRIKDPVSASLMRIAQTLEDTSYMNYIESLPDCHKCQHPFVIHRLKDQPSLWLQHLGFFASSLTKQDIQCRKE